MFDAVALASGADLQGLLADAGLALPLGISNGQVSHVPAHLTAVDALLRGVSFGGYLTPLLDGFHDLGHLHTRPV